MFFSRRDTEGQEDDIYTLEVETGRIERITDDPGSEFCPAWAPDGRSIAVARVGPGSQRDIRTITIDGDLLWVISGGFERMTEPDWSIVGNPRIAFAARTRGERYDVYVVPITDP